MRRLPDQRRRADDNGDGGAEPQVFIEEDPALRCRGEAGGQADAPEDQRIFGLEVEADDQAAPQQGRFVVVARRLEQQIADQGPGQGIQRRGVERGDDAHQHRSDSHSEAGACGREPVAAQQTREPHAEPAQRAGGQCRRQAQHPRAVAQGVKRGGQQRHHRRLIGVAEGRMAAANDEIELVAEDVVTPGEQGVQAKGQNADAQGQVVPRRFRLDVRHACLTMPVSL